jgi:hypothetical protein
VSTTAGGTGRRAGSKLIQSGIGGPVARLDERRNDHSSRGWSSARIATTVRRKRLRRGIAA